MFRIVEFESENAMLRGRLYIWGIYGIGLVGEFSIKQLKQQNETSALEHGMDESSIERLVVNYSNFS